MLVNRLVSFISDPSGPRLGRTAGEPVLEIRQLFFNFSSVRARRQGGVQYHTRLAQYLAHPAVVPSVQDEQVPEGVGVVGFFGDVLFEHTLDHVGIDESGSGDAFG